MNLLAVIPTEAAQLAEVARLAADTAARAHDAANTAARFSFYGATVTTIGTVCLALVALWTKVLSDRQKKLDTGQDTIISGQARVEKKIGVVAKHTNGLVKALVKKTASDSRSAGNKAGRAELKREQGKKAKPC